MKKRTKGDCPARRTMVSTVSFWQAVPQHKITNVVASRYKIAVDPLFKTYPRSTPLTVWLSGNASASINVVVLRQTRLVPGWVTVCGRVNHFGM